MALRLRVLIAGCGYVGTALGLALLRAGHEVFALSRNPDRLPSEFSRLHADLADPSTLRLPPGLDFAMFSASADESSDDAYRRTYVNGLSNLLEALASSPTLKRLFFTSSTAVYAQSDGGWVDEASPTEPRHFSGKRTLEAEEVALGSALPATVLRCSGIYGPERTRLVEGVRTGALRIPPEDHFTNRIHRDDIVGAVMHLMQTNGDVDRLLLSDDDPAPYTEVIAYLARRLGVPLPAVDPEAPPRARGGNKRCRNQRLHELGYELRFPSYRDGYAWVS